MRGYRERPSRAGDDCSSWVTDSAGESKSFTHSEPKSGQDCAVAPSIAVHVNPGLLDRHNRDTQIEMAVDVLLKQIKREPVTVPPPPWVPAVPKQPSYPPCPVSSGTCQ